jgi:folate-binding protein YgfZ
VPILDNDWKALLLASGATIEDGYVSQFSDPRAEVALAATSDILSDLSHLALIRAHGPDAENFLQGQLSNDIRLASDTQSQLSAYCNPKGRMLAILRVYRRGEAFFLQLPASLLEPTLKRLSMFVLRAKVKLEAVGAELACVGVSGPQATHLLEQAGVAVPDQPDACRTQGPLSAIRLPGPHPRYMVIGAVTALIPIWTQLRSSATPVGTHAWDWLDIAAGLPCVLPETVEEFVPQMTNLELVGGVSFKKGCYPGQEIVARMHYLGRLKQRMVRGHLPDGACPRPGSPVFAPDFPNQSAGTVVSAQLAPTAGCDILAVVQLSSIEKADLHLERLDGPALHLMHLPYSLSTSS